MKTRALKIVVAAMLVMSLLMTAAGAATITKTKFNSGTGLLTVEYYVSGDEAVITAYDPMDESNVIYFYQQPGSGTGTFRFTVPENYTGENVAVKVGGTNEASATTVVSVTPTPAPTPDPESTEMGGIYSYVVKEPFAEDTVVVDKENKKINMDSEFDIEVSNAVWKGIEATDDAFNFSSGYMYVDPLSKITREQITIKFAPITEGTAKISFEATMIANGKSWENPSYFGAVVDSSTHAETTVSGKNQITGLVTGLARVQSFNSRTILDNTSTKGIVRFDNTMNDSGKYTSYDLLINDNVKHNYEYIIDMTNKRYSLSVDGNLIGEYDFYDTSVEKIDAIKFYGSSYADSAHQNARYSVDNIVVKATQDIATNNIKFYNEAGTKLIKEINAHANKQIVPPTAPIKRDSTFVGWSLTSGGNDLVGFDDITEDMVVYASYMTRPIITYMDGEAVYNTQAVEYGETITAPTLEDKGEYKFIGWYTADGKAASFAEIKADMTVYSRFGIPDFVVTEDFGAGFVIDKTANKITTTSGLDVTAGVKFYAISSLSNGTLKSDGHTSANTAGSDTSVTFKFPEITSGKVYASFDLAFPNAGQTNWLAYNRVPNFAFGSSATGTNAAEVWTRGMTSATGEQSEINLTTKYGGLGAQNDVIGSIKESSILETISFVIDMNAKTYSVIWKGVTHNDIPFADLTLGSIDCFRIDLAATQHHNESHNILVDNLNINSYSEILGESKPGYEVIFYDENGTTELYRTTVEEGQTAVYGGATPTKAPTAQYTYAFSGWDKSLVNITAPTTVKAVYTQTVNKYTVTFKDYDGSTLGTSTVDYGTAAVAPSNPTREADSEYTYTFTGWDKSFSNVTGNMTVTAQYESTPIETEPEDEFIIFNCYGDYNGDGMITSGDISYLQSKIKGNARLTKDGYTIGELIPGTTLVLGDFNGDGMVTSGDISYLQSKIKGNARKTKEGYTIGAEAKIPVIK